MRTTDRHPKPTSRCCPTRKVNRAVSRMRQRDSVDAWNKQNCGIGRNADESNVAVEVDWVEEWVREQILTA